MWAIASFRRRLTFEGHEAMGSKWTIPFDLVAGRPAGGHGWRSALKVQGIACDQSPRSVG